MNGFLHHLLLTLRLNFRSRMPVVYGYLAPVFFLIAFAAVFHGIAGEMGQLITITVLGGACFGMPTAMVAERERGIWRRYMLLPGATRTLVFSTLIARLILVASGAGMQFGLAMIFYRMPLPAHPVQLITAFIFVAWAFLGMGLVIAMLADTVPAVQALGQVIFLPMILIGGVGVPLSALPGWAQNVAGFMPGRYAVAALDACIRGDGLGTAGFDLGALTVIGAAACLAAGNLFRWDAARKIGANQWRWTAVALAAWVAVGIVAPMRDKSAAISAAQINSITYDNLQDDNSLVTPLVNSVDGLSPAIIQWTADFRPKLADWPPGNEADPVQTARNLLAVAASADLDQYQYEGEVAYVVFDRLKEKMPAPQLEKVLAEVILHPDGGIVPASAAALGIPGQPQESDVRDRSSQYAKKLLGRLLGKLG